MLQDSKGCRARRWWVETSRGTPISTPTPPNREFPSFRASTTTPTLSWGFPPTPIWEVSRQITLTTRAFTSTGSRTYTAEGIFLGDFSDWEMILNKKPMVCVLGIFFLNEDFWEFFCFCVKFLDCSEWKIIHNIFKWALDFFFLKQFIYSIDGFNYFFI